MSALLFKKYKKNHVLKTKSIRFQSPEMIEKVMIC
jgi:hypothetical protein